MQDAVACPVVLEFLRRSISRANAAARSRAHCVRRFTVLPVDFSVRTGELTATMKQRRREIEKRHGDVIDAMYSGRGGVDVEDDAVHVVEVRP